MRTEDLIAELSEQPPRPASPRDRGMDVAFLAGAVVASAAGLFLSVGWRPDLEAVAAPPRFLFKVVVALALTFAGALACRRLMQPQLGARWAWWLSPVLALALAGAAFALLAGPPMSLRHAMPPGQTLGCVLLAIASSLLPTLAALRLMGQGAPSSPGAAGAAAGLLGSGLGLLAYILHCPMDSPLFVSVWYLAVTALVMALAIHVGRARLAW